VTVVGNHGDGFLVIASQDSEHRSSLLSFEGDTIADAELQHGLVSVHLPDQPEALHDAMIQVNELSFGQIVYVDAIHVRLPGIIRREQEDAKPTDLD